MPLTFKEQPREMVGMDEWHVQSEVMTQSLWLVMLSGLFQLWLGDCLICHRTPGKQ